MTATRLRPSRPPAAASMSDSRAGGPFLRVVVGSFTLSAAAGLGLTLGPFAGAVEHVTTGTVLLAAAAGWGMLAGSTARLTERPQSWAYVLAAFLGLSGLGLVALAPGDDGLTAAAWFWPPALLVLASWSARQVRSSLPGPSRWLVQAVLGALSLASIGAFVNDVALLRDDVRAAIPGQLHDVGGHRLHLHCVGSGSPTVVLENGLGGSSPLWTRITDRTAATTRVCTYDRAGQGWSDDAPEPQDSTVVARDLHILLRLAGEPGPYVLAGHSTGGVYALTYAARYPEQVAGLALLDSASPHQFTVLPDYADQYELMTRVLGVLPTLSRVGVGRLLPDLFANDVPGAAGRQAAAFARTPRAARTARDEVSTYRRSFEQAQALATLDGKPLVVVAASETLSGTAGWPLAQQQLAALSDDADLRTVDSSHLGLLDDATASTASAAAIADVVDAVRSGSPLSASPDSASRP